MPLGPHSWYRSHPLWEEAAPEPLSQGKTYAQAQLMLEIFIDHIKVTVILKSMWFLLEKKEKIIITIGEEKNKVALI